MADKYESEYTELKHKFSVWVPLLTSDVKITTKNGIMLSLINLTITLFIAGFKIFVSLVVWWIPIYVLTWIVSKLNATYVIYGTFIGFVLGFIILINLNKIIEDYLPNRGEYFLYYIKTFTKLKYNSQSSERVYYLNKAVEILNKDIESYSDSDLRFSKAVWNVLEKLKNTTIELANKIEAIPESDYNKLIKNLDKLAIAYYESDINGMPQSLSNISKTIADLPPQKHAMLDINYLRSFVKNNEIASSIIFTFLIFGVLLIFKPNIPFLSGIPIELGSMIAAFVLFVGGVHSALKSILK